MSTDKQSQYLAIDFLHADFEKASACAEMMVYGGLEYSLANAAGDDVRLESLYLLERETFDLHPERALSLIAKTSYSDAPVEPDQLRQEFGRIGREMLRQKDWQTGSIIRIAKLAAHGSDIFDRLDREDAQSVSIPVLRDEGNKKNRKPSWAVNGSFFSVNTSKQEPHWVGHMDDWDTDVLSDYNPLTTDRPDNIQMMTLTRV